MAIIFNNAPPKWNNAGVEPTEEEKQQGYVAKDKIPAPYQNFYLHRTGECIEELQNKLSNENTERETALENKVDKIEGMGLVGFGSTSDNVKSWETLLMIDGNGIPIIKKIPAYLSDLEKDISISVPIVNGTSTDGVAYTATVDGLDIEIGSIISFIPNMTSTSQQTTLNINEMGAIRIYQSLSSITSPMVSANNPNWLSEKRPILLMYHETTNSVGTVTRCWKTVATRTTDEDIYGTVGIEKGGTGGETAEEALTNLGVAGRLVQDENGNFTSVKFGDYETLNTVGRYTLLGGKNIDGDDGDYNLLWGRDISVTGLFCLVIGHDNTGKGGCYLFGDHLIGDDNQAVFGRYNVEYDGPLTAADGGTVFIIAAGRSDTQRANVFRVTKDGKCMGTQAFIASGADYAEFFEWLDGNPDNEDRRGCFVTLDGNRIRKANGEDDYILGVVSVTPSIVGNGWTDMWHNMYLTDIFGERLTEIVDVPETTDEKTGEVIPAHTETRFIVNPDYDPTEKYIGRELRKEWSLVGTHGQLVVVDDGSCEVNGYCKVADGGKAIKSSEKTEYRVIERLDDTHIRIYIK